MDRIERSAAHAALDALTQNGDADTIERAKVLIDCLPPARFTREDVEKAAIGMFNLRQGQRGTPNITFDQCVMLRDDWLDLATAALSAIGDVDHG